MAEATVSVEQVTDALHDVIDPELGYNIVDLGLVYDVEVVNDALKVTMTMTTPGCPAQDYIMNGVQERALMIPGVEAIDIDLVWEPRWSPQEHMSPAAKAHFGITEDAR
ncbi:MAG TPA: metal-sulfur cluster assembly factor [Gammaproteobacteria bacterium]|nr:metal-sulfur cluster assembly factor [Gammaproteobacteria bacterium]